MSLTSAHFYTIALISLLSLWTYIRSKRSSEMGPIGSILDMAAIPPLRHALPELELEVARARRLSHPLCVVIVRTDYETDRKSQMFPDILYFNKRRNSSVHGEPLDLQEFSDCSRAFRDMLRELDYVAFDSVNDQFVVVLPGSTQHQAVETMGRINEHLGPQIANRLHIGIAEYPRHGLFLEDLVEYGVDEIRGEPSRQEFELEARA